MPSQTEHHPLGGMIKPDDWHKICHRKRASLIDLHNPEATPWFPGDVAPVHVGWYDRYFTDGMYRQWWDGTQWMIETSSNQFGVQMQPHWRQVGDYPMWRGKKDPPP